MRRRVCALLVCLLLPAFLPAVLGQDTAGAGVYTRLFYPTGEKSSEGFLVGGRPDGWWKSYDRQGNLISEGNRKDFLLDGEWTFYGAGGQKQMTMTYRAGRKQGLQTVYSPEGRTVSHWRSDTLVGLSCTFDRQGRLTASVPHEDGLRHGLAKEYDTTGLVTAVTRYYRGVGSRRERVNRTDAEGNKQGSWKYFYDNGLLKTEGTYFNGKRHGFFKYYDENGHFVRVEKYEYGTLAEDARETKQIERRVAYHANGRPSVIQTYYRDRPEGIRRDYDTTGKIVKGYVFENGWLRFEGITDGNGLRQGVWKEYYPTGQLRSEGRYRDSRHVGPWKFYFTDQTVEISGNYDQKGRKDGAWLWFYHGGDTMIAAFYDAGDPDGTYAEYDEYGRPTAMGAYDAGYEEGDWLFRNGETVEKGRYDGGRRTGLWTTTYDDGTPAAEIHYDDGQRDGKYTAYWENGAVKSTGKYRKGLQDGTWYSYNKEGTLTLTTLFQNGIELKWNNYILK